MDKVSGKIMMKQNTVIELLFYSNNIMSIIIMLGRNKLKVD